MENKIIISNSTFDLIKSIQNPIEEKYIEYEFGQPVGIKLLTCPYFYYIGTLSTTDTKTTVVDNRGHYNTSLRDIVNQMWVIKNKKMIPGSKFFEL